jgi:hypothetical protein
MPVRRVKARPVRKPAPASKPRKPSLSAERLQELIAERAGEYSNRVAVRGTPENWDAILIVNSVGHTERRVRFWTIVKDIKGEFDLEG